MSMLKTGFVGSTEAELSVSTTFTDIVVAFDLGVPQAPIFTLKLPLVDAEGREGIFDEMLGALVEHVTQFFRHAGVQETLVTTLKSTLVKACSDLTTDDEMDRSGSGGSALLKAIIDLEPVSVFETRFKLPEGIIPVIHQKVVTAACLAAGVRSTRQAFFKAAEVREALSGKPIFKPVTRHQGENPPLPRFVHPKPTVTQAKPSLRDLVRKFKPQQGKKPTGPLFVLVYDVNGRPVGVRSIKGPGWAGISGKIAYNPATPEVQSMALGLMTTLKSEGVRGVKLRQSPTGTFYLWFVGPTSGLQRKLRISDHPKLVQDDDPRSLPERHTDFDLGPYNGKGRDEALAYVKTAAKDTVTLKDFKGTPVDLTIFVDPSRSEVQRLLRKDGVCRAWVSPDGNHLIAWEAGACLHSTVARGYLPALGWGEAIPVELWSPRVVRVSDSAASGPWYHNPEVASILSASPAVYRALGGAPGAIDYFDELTHGSWTEMPSSKTASSFSLKDIPTTFWVVLDLGINNLGSNPSFFDRAITGLEAGALDGVRGISDNGQIVRQFGYRGAILRMPGASVVEANHLSRVMYGNPAYLTSKNLLALFRIWDREPDTKLGRSGVMQNFADAVRKALVQDSINATAGHDLNYYSAESEAGRAWGSNPVELSSPEALSRWLFVEFSRSWGLSFTKPINFTQEDIKEAVSKALYRIGQVYQDEGEWVLKDSTLRIPPDSTLVVALDSLTKYKKDLAWWDTLTPEQQAYEQSRPTQSWFYKDYLTAQALSHALVRLRSLPFTVSFVDGPKLTQHLHDLQVKALTKSASPKSALFTRSPK